MATHNIRCAWLGAVTLALGVVWSTPTLANNVELVPLGDQAALMGRAVVASSRDAGSLWYNPAGLSWMATSSVNLNGSAFVLRTGTLPGLYQFRTEDGQRATEDEIYSGLISIPSALVYVRNIDEGLTGAFGVFVPYAVDITARREGGFDASGYTQADWRFLAISEVQDYRLGGGIGYRVTPALRVGGAWFAALRRERTALQAWSMTRRDDDDETTTDLLQLERFRQDFGTQATFGVQYQFHPHIQLGLSLRSPVYRLHGSVDEAQLALTSREDGSVFSPDTSSGWGFNVQESPAARLGFEWQVEDLSVNVEGEYRAATDELTDVINGRVGLGMFIKRDVIVGLGAFTDRSQTRGLDPGDFTADYYGGSFGVRFGALGGTAAKGETQFHTTLSLNYAMGFGRVGEVLFQPDDTGRPVAISSEEIATRTHDIGLYIGSGIEF